MDGYVIKQEQPIIILLGGVIYYPKLPEGASLFRPTPFKVNP
jgi:hypothetical protein